MFKAAQTATLKTKCSLKGNDGVEGSAGWEGVMTMSSFVCPVFKQTRDISEAQEHVVVVVVVV